MKSNTWLSSQAGSLNRRSPFSGSATGSESSAPSIRLVVVCQSRM